MNTIKLQLKFQRRSKKVERPQTVGGGLFVLSWLKNYINLNEKMTKSPLFLVGQEHLAVQAVRTFFHHMRSPNKGRKRVKGPFFCIAAICMLNNHIVRPCAHKNLISSTNHQRGIKHPADGSFTV